MQGNKLPQEDAEDSKPSDQSPKLLTVAAWSPCLVLLLFLHILKE